MKKRARLVLLMILATFCMAFLLAGCDFITTRVNYKLYFRVDGNVYAIIDTTGDEVIAIPDDPKKEGYDFDGWFWDNNVWERPFTANSLLDAPISSNMSVYAKFVTLHEHEPSENWSYDAENHWKDCTCDEKLELGAHQWTQWSVEKPATEEEAGLEVRTCTVCGQKEQHTLTQLPHTHSYTIENPSEPYLKTPANCYGGAIYYKSCSCGEKGTETFTYGDPVHQYKDTVYKPTCDSDGYIYHECKICGDNYSDNHVDHLEHRVEYHGMKGPSCLEPGNSEYWSCSLCHKLFSNRECTESLSAIPVLEATGHSYDSNWDHDKNYHWKNAICEHAEEKGCMALHDYDETWTCRTCGYEDAGVHGIDILPATLHKDGEALSLTVANAVTTYSLRNEFTVADGAMVLLSFNVECTQPIVSMAVSLSEGDNVFYLLVTNGNDSALYTITIRRRPMYTVSFDTDGGLPVSEQRVEEGSLAEEPSAEKTGYHFEGWDYNFSTPVTGNVTVKAKWRPNQNTKYTVEYYLENLEDSEFSLRESVICYGETDSTVKAEIRMYDHFTVRERDIEGTVSADGTAELKVYYTRDVYTVTFVGNGGTRMGGGEESQRVKYLGSATPPVYTYRGYNFTGFNGSYTNISASVTLTAQWSEIAKQNYDMTGITFANESLTFDGNAHSIFIKGNLPDGVEVCYEGNGQTNAGTHTITAKFTGNSETHYPIQDMTAVLTIYKAAYNMDGIQFRDKDVTYDGSRHTIAIEGQLPAGVYVQYYCGGEVFVGKVDRGRYEVRAKFTGDETNHLPIPEMAATLTISLQKLDTPTITKVEYDTVYWEPVENADSYTIRVNDNYWLSGVRGTECGLDKVLERGDGAKIKDYGIVRVEVRADEYDSYGASAWSNVDESYFYVPVNDSEDAKMLTKFSLGFGYNLIEDDYLDISQCSSQSVFDLGKLLTIGEYTTRANAKAEGSSYSYSSIDEFISKTMVSIEYGSEKGCALLGSIKTQINLDVGFDYQKYEYNNTFVYQWDVTWADHLITNFKSTDWLADCLSKSFLEDIRKESNNTQHMTDEQLVQYIYETYGTHAILGITTGGSYVGKYNISTNKKNIAVDVKAGFDMSTSGGALNQIIQKNFNIGVDLDEQLQWNNEETNSKFKAYYYGGSHGAVATPQGFNDALSDWSGSFDTDTAHSIKFTKNGAISIASLLSYANMNELAYKLEQYIDAMVDDTYRELFDRYNKSATLPIEMKTENGQNTVIVNLSSYPQNGNLNNAKYPSLENNVLTIYSTMFGKEVDAIKIKGAYQPTADTLLINGFSIKPSEEWEKDVKIILENVGIRAANERGFIEPAAGVKSYTIEYLGKNEIRGIDGTRTSNGSSALLLEGAALTIASQDASASLLIYGGNGANGVNASENGTDGGTAIVVEALTVNTAGKISIHGGTGGKAWDRPSGDNDGDGKNGRDGYQGGDGGIGVQATNVTMISGAVEIIGGNGGNGGSGSECNYAWGKTVYGGKGGDGGNGGIALSGRKLMMQGGDIYISGGNGGDSGKRGGCHGNDHGTGWADKGHAYDGGEGTPGFGGAGLSSQCTVEGATSSNLTKKNGNNGVAVTELNQC